MSLLDYAKLNDPTWKAEVAAEYAAEGAKIAENAKTNRDAFEKIWFSHREDLTDKERDFLKTVNYHMQRGNQLTPAQQKWLLDIARRF